MTPQAIDPGTVRPVAQRLNHYAIAKIFYLETRFTLYSELSVWRMAVQRSPLFQSAFSTNPRFLAECEGNIRSISIIAMVPEIFPFARRQAAIQAFAP